MLWSVKFFTLVFTFLIVAKAQSQCNDMQTITVCDMTILDGDSDTNPDGIINLYDAYNAIPGVTAISLATGTWFDPNFNFALDEATGDLYTWDLDNSSENVADYQFQLIDSASACPGGILITVNFILGPFSGNAIPTINANDVNVEICDIGVDPCGSSTFFDLNQALASIPSAHGNGTWSYLGTSPNFINIQSNRFFIADVPYQPGVPLVDEETFELAYTVPGIAPCTPSVETRVKVSVIREVFAGAANRLNICETELINGDFDADIDIRGDGFLVNEDIEGVWLSDADGQISGPADSMINLRALYDNLYSTNQRFGCASYDFTYSVESRSSVCSDKTSTVNFNFLEYLRPFQQTQAPPTFCVGDDSLTTTNLYNLLTFTTENGVLYDYPNTGCNNWTLISGPSNLGLQSNSGNFCSPSNPNYTALGTIDLSNLSNADAGTYVFEYVVLSEYNCSTLQPELTYSVPDGCTSNTGQLSPCNSERAQVTIVIEASNYAGEDTMGLEFCESALANPVDLITLLGTNGIETVYQGNLGVWLDNLGNPIANPFTLPTINNQQTFSFVYTTSSANGCTDRADLSFTVYEQYQSGVDTTIEVCNTDAIVNLFNLLDGSPDTTGTWAGPNGFTTTDNNAMFDPSTSTAGNYVYTVPDNGPCLGNQATLIITIAQGPSAGADMQAMVCRSDNFIDLSSLIDSAAQTGGTFIDVDATNALSGNVVDLTGLAAGSYNFEYEVQGSGTCGNDTAIITITVTDVNAPTSANQSFCINDGARVSDLQVGNATNFNWYADATSTTPLPSDTVLVNGEDYFVVAIDGNGCESLRVRIVVDLLPFGSSACQDCISDGVSANDDTINDELELCDLPVTFPNYEIKIFNRYGSVVFKGNNATGLFKGNSNTGLTIGDELPSGVYFYIFDPKDNVTAPFQGNFYLSR